MERDRPPATRRRILAAAGELFAERGFRATTMREIAQRARVNLAAAHYHFGSKQELYLEVVRGEFEKLEKRLAARGASPGAALDRPLARASSRSCCAAHRDHARDPARRVERARRAHAARDVRSERGAAGDRGQFIDPQRREHGAPDRARSRPELSPAEVERCVRSIVGQIFFYLTHRPALLLMMGRRATRAASTREVAEHIMAFSLRRARAARRGAPRGEGAPCELSGRRTPERRRGAAMNRRLVPLIAIAAVALVAAGVWLRRRSDERVLHRLRRGRGARHPQRGHRPRARGRLRRGRRGAGRRGRRAARRRGHRRAHRARSEQELAVLDAQIRAPGGADRAARSHLGARRERRAGRGRARPRPRRARRAHATSASASWCDSGASTAQLLDDARARRDQARSARRRAPASMLARTEAEERQHRGRAPPARRPAPAARARRARSSPSSR